MSLKPFVNNNELWEDFCTELDARINEHHKSLEQAENISDMHRAQGAIFALRKLKFLKDKVNGPRTTNG